MSEIADLIVVDLEQAGYWPGPAVLSIIRSRTRPIEAALSAATARAEAAEAIVDRLPRTADGVPVVPGLDRVYWPPADDGKRWLDVACNGYVCAWTFDDAGSERQVEVSECYSTKEAAEKAKDADHAT